VLTGDTRLVEFAMPLRDAKDGYAAGVERWHDAIAAQWEQAITQHKALRPALLVWGDPSLYDSTLRIAQRIGQRLPITLSVIPGITAIQALCAAHAIPLNALAAPVLVTTGRQLRDHGWPDCADRIVVMLDGECSFQGLKPQGVRIWWGAYLGMPNQLLDHGPLAQAAPRIIARRAKARADHGWIMDIYLMQRDPA
jgi:precorrin-6A synthase